MTDTKRTGLREAEEVAVEISEDAMIGEYEAYLCTDRTRRIIEADRREAMATALEEAARELLPEATATFSPAAILAERLNARAALLRKGEG